MKPTLVIIALALAASPAAWAKSSHGVHGYTKKDGTTVQPHRATNPDKTKKNNYSSKGNTNPNTGKQGTKDPDAPKKP